MIALAQCSHWVFDMDGTLTLPAHDFPAIKRALDIPQEHDILHHLASLPAAEAAAKHAWLLEHERELALAAEPAPGAPQLIRALHARGVRLGILTRNAYELALITLQAIGIAECFANTDILGRDEAEPKPAADGLYKLARQWDVAPSDLVMVGDFRFDLECAQAAGATGVLVNTPENLWPELTAHHARDCAQLLSWLG